MLPGLDYAFVYFIGIGGIGMSALARLLAVRGYPIFGYDRVLSPLVRQLQAEDMLIHCDELVASIPAVVCNNPHVTLVIYTPAIPEDNAILSFFRKKGYTLLSRAEVLGLMAKHLPMVAIAGTHGKTTTSAMVAHMFYQSALPMMAFVGGIMHGYNSNIIYNKPLDQLQLLVAEADEFNKSFLHLTPTYSAITAIDLDHLDTYPNLTLLMESFRKFLDQSKQTIVVHKQVADRLQLEKDYPKPFLTYGLNQGAIQADNIHTTSSQSVFDYIGCGLSIRGIVLPMQGLYNIENALVAITMGLLLDLSETVICNAMASFRGIQRRFSVVFENASILLIDDYAHHPVEVHALLTTVKHNYPHSFITAIFQPHLFSRTATFYEAFAQSLSIADQVFLLPIYPARENPIPGITAQLIWDHLSHKRKALVTLQELPAVLANHTVRCHHVVLTIGAGDIGEVVPTLTALWKE